MTLLTRMARQSKDRRPIEDARRQKMEDLAVLILAALLYGCFTLPFAF